MDNYRSLSDNANPLAGADESGFQATGYGALAASGQMSAAEKQLYIQAFNSSQAHKMHNMTKGDRLKYEKVQTVLKDQMSMITDTSAITIHGLNSELSMITN